MGIYCPDYDMRWPDVCDFCIHYCFNGRWYWDYISERYIYVYNGEGFCWLNGTYADPADGCDNFHCFKAVKPIL